MNDIEHDQLLTKDEVLAAFPEFAKCSPNPRRLIDRLRACGRLPCVRVGKPFMYRKSGVVAFLRGQADKR